MKWGNNGSRSPTGDQWLQTRTHLNVTVCKALGLDLKVAADKALTITTCALDVGLGACLRRVVARKGYIRLIYRALLETSGVEEADAVEFRFLVKQGSKGHTAVPRNRQRARTYNSPFLLLLTVAPFKVADLGCSG